MSSWERKRNWWHAVFVGILSGILIGIYAALIPPDGSTGITPLFWACFITLPTVFMFGGQWKDIVPLILNAWFGYLCGIIVFYFCGITAASITLAGAFGVFTCILTIVLQGLTSGALPPALGKTPMAFVGMVCCFASPAAASLGMEGLVGPTSPAMQTLIVAFISLAVGVIAATCMVQTGKWAAKLAGPAPKDPANADKAE